MEKSKQITHQGNQTGNTSAMFWGTIALGVIGIVAVLFTLVPMLQLPREGVVYFGMVLYSLTSVAGMTVIILTLRGRQDLGAQLAFYMVLLVFMSSPVIFVGRALTAFSSLFAISGIIILQLLPRALRRRYITITGVALILIWVLEWINPSWRLQTEVGRGGGPVTAIIFGLILAIILIRQAWGGNIRLKLVTSFTVIALISVGIVGTVIYINYRNQVREDIRQRLFNILSLVAMNQDGDLHSTILGPEDANDESHLSIMAQNVQYLATDPALKYIYTMRKNEQGQIYFVINARQGGEPGDPIGTIYNEPSELLATNFDTLSEPVMEEDLYTDVYGQVLASYAPFYRSDGTREGIIGVDIDAENVLAAERSVLNLILGTTVATMFLVTLLGLWLGNLFVGPVVNLSHTTQKIIDGDLSARAEIETADEVGDLAKAFNTMTSQLQGTLQGLEQRIADRTRNLELAAEVGRAVSQVRSLDVMLKDACELILKEFNLYYVQVYLTDASSPKLNLEAGTGSVGAQLIGRGHNLPLDTGSINGRAAVEKRSVVISDTSQSAAFRQNPLLPETRGEMAVPLIVANKVVGVLDMQSREPGVLSKEVLPAFEALAGQLAVAIQNSNLLAETEQARAEVEKQARRLVRTGWSEHLDAIHKPEKIGFVFDQDNVVPLDEQEETRVLADENSVSAPIAITGEPLGSLVVEVDESRRDQATELVQVVARQMAQHIENLRLLESAERYRREAEQAARMQTIDGWKNYIASRPTESLGYLYDTNEVVALRDSLEGNNATTLPLKVRDETIGKLVVQGLGADDRDSLDLANAVVERLVTHIESLRQFEETKHGQVELDKRARQLAAVAEVSSVSSRELDIQKMLESVVHLTQRKFGLYHVHVFLYDDKAEEFKIAACGWKEGDEHEGTHEMTTIPFEKEQSLVARAARSRKAVIVNNVLLEPGWLPNPLLPDTASELAVPLVVGDQLLGVLDVQADHINAFTEEDANIQMTLASQVATALQNARSFNQAQSALTQSEKLFRASGQLTQATDLQSLVKTVAETMDIPVVNRVVLDIFNYNSAGELESMDVGATWWNGTGHEASPIGQHFPASVLRVMPLFISSTPLFFADSLTDERFDESSRNIAKDLNIRSGAVLPLHSGSHQVGVLLMEAEDPHNFTNEEIRLFEALAPQITTVLENRRQFERAQKQAEREAMLNIINQKIQGATSVEAVLQIAARELGHALGAPMTIAQLSMKDKSS